MKRKELPVGLQTFHTIRKEQGEYYYVDKTDYAYQLARKAGHFFLSRPRRFGKSLFVDTLKNLFEGDLPTNVAGRCLERPAVSPQAASTTGGVSAGRISAGRNGHPRQLINQAPSFDKAGLAIYDKWDCALPTVVADRRLGRSAVSKYPVLRLDFGGATFTDVGRLERNITKQLRALERRWKMKSDIPDAQDRFGDLIERLAEDTGERVVVLVDEYDEPDLSTDVAGRRRQAATGSVDVIDRPGMEGVAQANLDYLRGLYGNIKRCEANIRFSFLTGVSKFFRAGIFSGINNLRDITLSPEFSSICGYTDHDIDTVFAPELEVIHPEFGKLDREEIKECALPTDVTGRQSGTGARSGRPPQGRPVVPSMGGGYVADTADRSGQRSATI